MACGAQNKKINDFDTFGRPAGGRPDWGMLWKVVSAPQLGGSEYPAMTCGVHDSKINDLGIFRTPAGGHPDMGRVVENRLRPKAKRARAGTATGGTISNQH